MYKVYTGIGNATTHTTTMLTLVSTQHTRTHTKTHIPTSLHFYTTENCIGGVMVSVLASSAVDRWFEPQLGQTKDYKIGICCSSAKHTALRKKNKDWLARNQNNVSEWSDMSTRGQLFQ
jgi:hypothetical protein